MKGSFWLREWGATTFIVTTLIGLVVVPIALYFGHRSAAESAGNITTPASAAQTATPTASPTP